MRRRAQFFALLPGLLAGAVPVAASASAFSPEYRALVDRYRSGDRDGAVLELGRWPEWRVKEEIPVLASRATAITRLTLAVGIPGEAWAGFPMKAALMLHTDSALRARRDGDPPWLHESVAWSMAHALAGVAAERDFVRCLTWLAVIDFECGRHAEAEERCRELRHVAERMGDGQAPVADGIEALVRFAEASAAGLQGLDAALSRVRAVDDKSYLSYALNAAALLCFRRGQRREATAYADEALKLATAMERHNEVSIAEAMLARVRPGPSPQSSSERIRDLRQRAADNDRFSARTRAFLDEVADLERSAAGDASKHSCRARKRR